MKKTISAIFAFILIFTFLLNTVAFAATMADPYISSMSGGIASEGNGKIKITFSVRAKDIMSTLGATSIVIYKSDGSYVTTLYSTSYPSMLTTNARTYSSSVNYNGVSGQNYYAIITFYASTGGGSSSPTYTTSVCTA